MKYREILRDIKKYFQNPSEVMIKPVIKVVEELNREQMDSLLSNYVKKESEIMERQLQQSEYICKLKKTIVRTEEEELIYLLGKFEGITRTVDTARRRQFKRIQTQSAMKRILTKRKTKEILQFIYEHPNAQNKDIAKVVDLKPNTLSYRMKELVEVGGVESYWEGKYKYYDLTLQGREFLETLTPERAIAANKRGTGVALRQFYNGARVFSSENVKKPQKLQIQRGLLTNNKKGLEKCLAVVKD